MNALPQGLDFQEAAEERGSGGLEGLACLVTGNGYDCGIAGLPLFLPAVLDLACDSMELEMTVQTTISLDATLYSAIEEKVGPDGVSDFVNSALSKVLSGRTPDISEQGSEEQVSVDYFDAFTEKERTLDEMAKCSRERLELLRDDLHRADFPPSI